MLRVAILLYFLGAGLAVASEKTITINGGSYDIYVPDFTIIESKKLSSYGGDVLIFKGDGFELIVSVGQGKFHKEDELTSNYIATRKANGDKFIKARKYDDGDIYGACSKSHEGIYRCMYFMHWQVSTEYISSILICEVGIKQFDTICSEKSEKIFDSFHSIR